MYAKSSESWARNEHSIMVAPTIPGNCKTFHYRGTNQLLGWQNCIDQSIVCGWSHHSNQNNVEKRLQGDAARAICSLCIQPSLSCSHDLSHRSFLERERMLGETYLEQGLWDAREAEHSPWHTGEGLIWSDFCFPFVFKSIHRAKINRGASVPRGMVRLTVWISLI